MNPHKVFNKWWLMVTQGIFLVSLSYFLFSHSDIFIPTASIVIGFIALLTGSASVIGYFLAGKNEKSRIELFSGVFSCLAGLFFVSGIPLAHQVIAWFFAAYMTFNAIMLLVTSWKLKFEINWWWFSFVILLYTVIIDYLYIAGTSDLSITITVLAGVQFFLNGVLIVVLAFVVRKMQLEYGQTISQLRSRQEN